MKSKNSIVAGIKSYEAKVAKHMPEVSPGNELYREKSAEFQRSEDRLENIILLQTLTPGTDHFESVM